jgi:hypothetical protein
MTIRPQIQKKYVKEILRTIGNSQDPLGIPQVMEKMHAADAHLRRDLAVALLWHLLNRQELQFDSARKLKLGHKSKEAAAKSREALAV